MPKLKKGNERFLSCKLRRIPLNAGMLNEYVGPSDSDTDGFLVRREPEMNLTVRAKCLTVSLIVDW